MIDGGNINHLFLFRNKNRVVNLFFCFFAISKVTDLRIT